ncbi:MAG: membrane protein insertase YidC [Porticoccus sp.]|jgi:YidC/Oxa1 family membrane protein insertase|nr:membrane protein insertase YidC [Porticoccus sp.]
MDWQRSFIIGAMLVVLYMLFLEWDGFQTKRFPVVSNTTSSELIVPQILTTKKKQAKEDTEDIPESSISTSQKNFIEAPKKNDNYIEDRIITVTTDVLRVHIDRYGGDIVRVELLDHLQDLKNKETPFLLLNRTANSTYIAQSGLIGINGTDTKAGRPTFQASFNQYQLENNEDTLIVDLTYNQENTSIVKRYLFKRKDYLINLEYQIKNQAKTIWEGGLYGQIKRDSLNPNNVTALGMQPFLGAALTTTEKNYQKLGFSEIANETFKGSVLGGWVAMVQHYFVSAWVPDQTTQNNFNIRKINNQDFYIMGFTSPQVRLKPGEKAELTAGFYAGPKDQYRLEELSPYLDLTVDYGWLWMIAKPLFWVLYQLHQIIGNWGWSIIMLTVLIKAAFFQLSAKSYVSMANMRKLQPEMLRLKELYGDDRQKMSQETMNLYKREKVNPMGGCLPILVQMPVFIALYWVLMESVELRHAPWVLWINDLSVKDPFFVLPLIMGASMFIQMQLNPTPPDPIQAKVMKIMPIAFTFFFLFFPAGLVLYWTVNNCLSILQQWLITRRIENA